MEKKYLVRLIRFFYNIPALNGTIGRTGNRHIASVGIICCLVMGMMGCATVSGVSESPMRYGVGVNMTPGLQLGNSNSSAHLQIGYAYVPFKGGGGHNNFFQAGAQYRYAFSKNAPEGFWAGAEATYVGIRNKYKSSSTKQTANGFTVGAIGGYRFLIADKVPVSFYVAPAYLNRGKFKTNGTTGGESSSGFYGRAGLDFHLFSLFSKKGR